MERYVPQLMEALRESGLRLTHQRLEVAREIAGADAHPDVDTIHRGVRARVPTISLDTVYRTLGTLETLGFVRKVGVVGGPARYDVNLEPHHHFFCTRCGSIDDVDSGYVEGLNLSDSAPELGRLESVTVELRGLCARCQRSDDQEAATAGRNGYCSDGRRKRKERHG